MTVLVLDIGSSSARALLFDETARLIPGAEANTAYQMNTSPPGAATLDPYALQSIVEAGIDEVLQHPAARDIRVVGLATLAGNVLGLDETGDPLTPIFTYADTRCAEDVAYLKTVVDEASLHQLSGCLLHTAYLPGRLHWLRRTEPEVFARVPTWVDFGTYLYRRWFGSSACSYSVASWTGMLKRADLGWLRQWLDALQLPESVLPPLADYTDMQRGLLPDYARRWPALQDVPFCLAVGDGVAANIGSGCVDESRIALTVGTTAALRLLSGDILPTVPDGLWSYRVDARFHLVGGATSEGGNIYGWLQDTLQLDQSLDEHLMSRIPDSHGLTFLPLLAGERSPGWAVDATGAIVGLRLSTTPLDIAQAALEGVALRLSLIADQLTPLVSPDVSVIGGGGALRASVAWAHIITNALDRPLHVLAEDEVTARGAAILALRAIGLASLDDFPPTIAYSIEPVPALVEILRAARARQLELYTKTVVG